MHLFACNIHRFHETGVRKMEAAPRSSWRVTSPLPLNVRCSFCLILSLLRINNVLRELSHFVTYFDIDLSPHHGFPVRDHAAYVTTHYLFSLCLHLSLFFLLCIVNCTKVSDLAII